MSAGASQPPEGAALTHSLGTGVTFDGATQTAL